MNWEYMEDVADLHGYLIMANWPAIGSIILPNVGGWANGLYFAGQISRKDNEKTWYDDLKKPSWNPPKWVFGPAWTVLYSSMGYASYLVLEETDGFTESAILPMTLYGSQLLLNWAWTPIFFGLKDFKLVNASKQTGSGSNDIYVPALWYYPLFQFLEGTTEPCRPGTDTLDEALIEIAVLSGTATATAASFAAVSRAAGALLLPYLAWLGYAASLNYYIWKNNPQPAKVTEIKDEKKEK